MTVDIASSWKEEKLMAKWVIDPDHSVAAFAVRHMMVSNVRGQFNKIAGTIYFDPADIDHSYTEAEIEAAGITTGIAKRDEHLRSPDFFDVAAHPKIRFRSSKVEAVGGSRFNVIGELTIRGITRIVTLQAEYFGPVKGTDDETSIGFSATVRINREDYGITWNVALEDGGVVVGKDVQIVLDIEADLAE